MNKPLKNLTNPSAAATSLDDSIARATAAAGAIAWLVVALFHFWEHERRTLLLDTRLAAMLVPLFLWPLTVARSSNAPRSQNLKLHSYFFSLLPLSALAGGAALLSRQEIISVGAGSIWLGTTLVAWTLTGFRFNKFVVPLSIAAFIWLAINNVKPTLEAPRALAAAMHGAIFALGNWKLSRDNKISTIAAFNVLFIGAAALFFNADPAITSPLLFVLQSVGALLLGWQCWGAATKKSETERNSMSLFATTLYRGMLALVLILGLANAMHYGGSFTEPLMDQLPKFGTLLSLHGLVAIFLVLGPVMW